MGSFHTRGLELAKRVPCRNIRAARQAARLGFEELGLTRLEIVALTHNLPSQKVAESIGAVRECQARNRLYFQGQPHDALVYSLVPQTMAEWSPGQ
jgi:RimJ/RimL family protein N-acetyltransferase